MDFSFVVVPTRLAKTVKTLSDAGDFANVVVELFHHSFIAIDHSSKEGQTILAGEGSFLGVVI